MHANFSRLDKSHRESARWRREGLSPAKPITRRARPALPSNSARRARPYGSANDLEHRGKTGACPPRRPQAAELVASVDAVHPAISALRGGEDHLRGGHTRLLIGLECAHLRGAVLLAGALRRLLLAGLGAAGSGLGREIFAAARATDPVTRDAASCAPDPTAAVPARRKNGSSA